MATYRELLLSLNHSDLAIENCISEMGIQEGNHYLDSEPLEELTPQQALLLAFDWENSKEGYQFWQLVCMQAEDSKIVILPTKNKSVIIRPKSTKDFEKEILSRPSKEPTGKACLMLSQKALDSLISIIEGAYSIDIEGEFEDDDSFSKQRIKEYKAVKKAFKENNIHILENLRR